MAPIIPTISAFHVLYFYEFLLYKCHEYFQYMPNFYSQKYIKYNFDIP